LPCNKFFSYDISDYYGVNPAYGTLGDFVGFTHGAEQRGIRVVIDQEAPQRRQGYGLPRRSEVDVDAR
jgi:Alpha amylase, catalytic domain